MMNLAITRHELLRRQAQMADLQRYLADQEQSFSRLRADLQCFVERYIEQLGPLYLELDALESQVHQAVCVLCEALQRSGMSPTWPQAPRATDLPSLACLPEAAPLSAPPEGGLEDMAPPTLKQLYRRAAMRLHPDLAASEGERHRREQQMMAVNKAYASADRPQLEALLLACGEPASKVSGSDRQAQLQWIMRAEQQVQGRLRVVQAYLVALQAHPMHQLWHAIVRAEAKGLDPMGVMANRLRSQISERRQELYIGRRLNPQSGLAERFLQQRVARMGAAASC